MTRKAILYMSEHWIICICHAWYRQLPNMHTMKTTMHNVRIIQPLCLKCAIGKKHSIMCKLGNFFYFRQIDFAWFERQMSDTLCNFSTLVRLIFLYVDVADWLDGLSIKRWVLSPKLDAAGTKRLLRAIWLCQGESTIVCASGSITNWILTF